MEDETKHTNVKGWERKWLFISEKRPKAQLQHRPNDGEKVEYLQYQLYDNITKERWAQNTVVCIQSEFVSAMSAHQKYHHHLLAPTRSSTGSLTDGFSDFLYDFLKEIQRLFKKQREGILLIVKTELDSVDGFRRSLSS